MEENSTTIDQVTIPTEDEIRQYLMEHIEAFSLIDYAKWVIEKTIKGGARSLN